MGVFLFRINTPAMKQSITKEQWDETDIKIQSNWIHRKVKGDQVYLGEYPIIGQLIEFLGDDLFNIEHCIKKYNPEGKEFWAVNAIEIDEEKLTREPNWFPNPELIDALWEATKAKLKNNG